MLCMTMTLFFVIAIIIGINNIVKAQIHYDASGNVGIGTTSPASKLEKTGMVQSTSGGFKLPDGTVLDDASDLGGGSEQ